MELTNFNFKSHNIRVAEFDGGTWFVATDVLRTLGSYIKSSGEVNTSHVKRFMGEDEYRLPPNSIGGRLPLLISESGLYKLIMRSDKPKARAFQNWVTGTVLPSIRKDGGYIMGEEKVATGELSEDQFILQAMAMLKNKADRLQKKVSDHLEYMTVNEFFALKHIYPAKGDNQSLGRRASMICANKEMPKRIQRRYAPAIEMMVEVGEYPVAVLEEAFDGMVKIGRIPAGLPQMDLGLVG